MKILGTVYFLSAFVFALGCAGLIPGWVVASAIGCVVILAIDFSGVLYRD